MSGIPSHPKNRVKPSCQTEGPPAGSAPGQCEKPGMAEGGDRGEVLKQKDFGSICGFCFLFGVW